ncbi:MAG TPA: MEDS domain-containing protein [Candidatus Binatia bacterium]
METARARTTPLAATTPSGICGIEDLRWGSHICQWYLRREDLAQTLVPYFEAGLKNRERCVWVTAAPYEMADAKRDLEAAVAGLDRMIADKQMRIVDAGGWYVNGNSLRGLNVVEHWLAEEREALAAGYSGLRIATNTSFVSEDDWRLFIEYENGFNQEMLQKHRIVALCSYNLLAVTPARMFDAVHSHQVTIHRAGTDWQALEL